MEAIILDHVCKTFSCGKRAVDSVSLSLEEGEVFGFLGPNGAGKTTTVKLLNGMLMPTEGTCKVFDMDPAREPEKVHACSGVVTEHAQMYDTMTGLQNLVFYGTIFGLNAAESEKRGRQLLKQMELEEAADRKLSTYSTGMRQRLSLARALVHEPRILFLDEPTTYLDIRYQIEILNLVQKLNREFGITIVMVLHDINQAIHFSDQIIGLAAGKVLVKGAPGNVISAECIQKLYGIELGVTEIDGKKFVLTV